jgi:hypothetical protein
MIFFSKKILLLLFPVIAAASPPADTAINGVKIEFEYSSGIFPASWQASPISAKGEAISNMEINRSKMVMTLALFKYPASMLRQDLASVYFVRNMKFFDTPYGGTNSLDAVYISNDGVNLGFTNQYLEQTFHHELSSILFRNHSGLLDTTEWKKANISTFDYNDPENGVGSIRKNQTSQQIDTALCKQGFLTEYSLSSLENDINTFAQNLFCPSADFWRVAEKYPRVGKKTKLLISFYQNINPLFTEAYFRKFKPQL